MKCLEASSATYDYTTWQVMQEYMPRDLLTDFSGRFEACDPKKTGVVKIEDVTRILRSLGRNVNEEQVRVILQDLTGDCKSTCLKYLDFKEYMAVLSVLVTNCISEDEMYLVFRQFDKDGDGYISPGELRDLLEGLGEEITDDDLQAMMREADRDGDGRVSYNEFVRMMTNSDGPEETSPPASPVPSITISSDSEYEFSDAELSDIEDEIEEEPLNKTVENLLSAKMESPRTRSFSVGNERPSHARTPPCARRKHSLADAALPGSSYTLPATGRKTTSLRTPQTHRRKKSLTDFFHLSSSGKRKTSRQSCPDMSIPKETSLGSEETENTESKRRFSLGQIFKRKSKHE